MINTCLSAIEKRTTNQELTDEIPKAVVVPAKAVAVVETPPVQVDQLPAFMIDTKTNYGLRRYVCIIRVFKRKHY